MTQEGSSSNYSPKDDEAIEQDEIDNTLLENEDKVSKKNKKAVKKKSRRVEKPFEMAPGVTRVMTLALGGIKRVLAGLDLDGVELARVTRQKTKKLSLNNHGESPLHMDEGSHIALTMCTDQPLEVTEFSEHPEKQRQMDDEDTTDITTMESVERAKGLKG